MIHPTFTKYLRNDFNLIEELEIMRLSRNCFAHGVVFINPESISILIIAEIHAKNAAWGTNPKYEFTFKDLDNLKKSFLLI